MTKTVQVAIRLESELVADADALAHELAATTPGFEPTRTSVLRAAIVRGLAALRSELATKRLKR